MVIFYILLTAQRVRRIIISKPKILESKIHYIEYSLGLRTDHGLKAKLASTFNYKGFRISAKCIWLGERLNIKSCLYCSSQYTITTLKGNKKRKLLYEFDHYYPKSIFPYLSLSFYNLIPVCSNCNKAKSFKKATIKNSFHPYEGESIHDVCVFSYNNIKLVEYLTNRSYDIEVNFNSITGATRQEHLKYKNHEKTFGITHLYKHHLDVAEELIWKAIAYPPDYKEKLVQGLASGGIQLFRNEADVERFIVGNYTNKIDFLKRPLTKFTSDLSIDLGVVKRRE